MRASLPGPRGRQKLEWPTLEAEKEALFAGGQMINPKAISTRRALKVRLFQINGIKRV